MAVAFVPVRAVWLMGEGNFDLETWFVSLIWNRFFLLGFVGCDDGCFLLVDLGLVAIPLVVG